MTTDSAVARAERTLARALLFFRVGGLVEIVLAGALDLARYRHPLIAAALVALVVAESVLLVGACLRIGNVRAGWVAADVVFCTINGGGHQWPGGDALPLLGTKSDDLIATDAIWDFFVAHPR